MIWYSALNLAKRATFSSPSWVQHRAWKICMDKRFAFKLFDKHSGCSSSNFTQRAFLNTSPIEVNTNIIKDVILYRYDNPKFFRNLNFFAICQFLFWSYLSHFAYTTLKDAPVPKEDDSVPWWRKINLGENKYRNTLTTICFLIGYGILAASWLYTLKSVRYVILRKGGKQVTFITYTPYGHNRMLTVDLTKVSSQESRQNARVTLPVKIKNFSFYYMLDMKGEFRNPTLFDTTVGLYRPWQKK